MVCVGKIDKIFKKLGIKNCNKTKKNRLSLFEGQRLEQVHVGRAAREKARPFCFVKKL